MKIDMPVILVVVVTALTASCSSELGKAEKEFASQCMSVGWSMAACKCSLDGLKKKYGDDIVLRVDRGNAPPDFALGMKMVSDKCWFQ